MNNICFIQFSRLRVCNGYQICYFQKRLNHLQTDNALNNSTKSDINSNDLKSEESLIYSGPESLTKIVKTVKTFSISTTLMGCGVQPFIFQKMLTTSSSFAIGFTALTSCGIILSPLLLNWFTKRYVTELYYNRRTQVFTAWTLNLFNRKFAVTYKASDVTLHDIPRMFTTFAVGSKKRPLFIDQNSVEDLEAYKHMLGYDKPIDLRVNQIISQNHKQQ